MSSILERLKNNKIQHMGLYLYVYTLYGNMYEYLECIMVENKTIAIEI